MTLISDDTAARTVILQVIAETYGDTSTTILDHRCAEAILLAMREMGWVSPAELALMVLHGQRDSRRENDTVRVKLTVDDQSLIAFEDRPPPVVTRWREPALMATSIVIEQRAS